MFQSNFSELLHHQWQVRGSSGSELDEIFGGDC